MPADHCGGYPAYESMQVTGFGLWLGMPDLINLLPVHTEWEVSRENGDVSDHVVNGYCLSYPNID